MLLAALGVIGVVAAVATGRVRGGLDEPTTSRPYRALPERALVASDVDAVRFSLGLRGYRMDEVDEVLGRLRDELADRDVEIARFRQADGGATARTIQRSEDGDGIPAAVDGTTEDGTVGESGTVRDGSTVEGSTVTDDATSR